MRVSAYPTAAPPAPAPVAPQPAPPQLPQAPTTGATGHVNGVTWKMSMPETFIEIDIAGYKHKCLLDTGCDYSLIPRRLVPTAKLGPVDLNIFAANGAPIEILGHMTVEFGINGMQVLADLLVSDEIYEFMLGYNWLAEQGIH